MEQTTIALPLGKQDIQKAVTALIEELTLNPFQLDMHTENEQIFHNMGMSILFETLRSTF